MSPVTRLSALAFASAVLAVPHAQSAGHGHSRFHGHGSESGSAALPSSFHYPLGNSTGAFAATGSGVATTSTSKALVNAPSDAPAGYGSDSDGGKGVSAAAVAASSDGALCGRDVTVTSTDMVTVYVTAGETASSSGSTLTIHSTVFSTVQTTIYPSKSSASSVASSSEAAPVSSSTSVTSSTSVYVPTTSSTIAAPVVTSSSSSSSSEVVSAAAWTPATSSSWVSSSAASSPPAYSQASKDVSVSSSSSSAAASSSSSSSGSGKRGLAYNSASLTEGFMSSPHVSWAYNWGSASSGLGSGIAYIPTLWGTGSDFVGSWSSNAHAAISAGSKMLFSFNEPDESSQSNMSPAAAAAGYMTYMMPFAGGSTKLCAPSVTNGGGSMGLTWLQNFLDACTSCQIDCINIHWYNGASDTEDFKSHVTNATTLANGKPVYVTEFGASGSDAQVQSFLQEVMPWMDSQSGVAGYAYYMVAEGLLTSGSQPSNPVGTTYMSYSG